VFVGVTTDPVTGGLIPSRTPKGEGSTATRKEPGKTSLQSDAIKGGLNYGKMVKIKFACEFKRPGCKINKDTGVMSTQAQVDEQEAMRLAGWFVFECSSFDKFKSTVLSYEAEHA
jgi:multimeric flavodoxin WrbA